MISRNITNSASRRIVNASNNIRSSRNNFSINNKAVQRLYNTSTTTVFNSKKTWINPTSSISDRISSKRNMSDNSPLNMSSNPYQPMLDELRATFESNVTKDLEWRKATLKAMLKMFTEGDNLEKWVEARISDLGGGYAVGASEIITVTDEIKHCLECIDEWAADRPAGLRERIEIEGKDRRVVRPTPKGVTLTIGSWNFPINVQWAPVVNCVAAGNCCFLKPSEISPATAQLVEEMTKKYLPSNAFKVVQGGIPETTNVLALKFDHITITGSSFVGKIVMNAAAQHLTPCTLELGGKNPTFVDKSANIDLAVDRMVLPKTHNAGQWCLDLDYVLVDETIAEEFTDKVVKTVQRIIGDEKAQAGEGIDVKDRWYNSIVNERNAERLKSYLEEDHGGKVILGGLDYVDVTKKFFPMTVVVNPKEGTKLMTEEIFGPIIVVKTVKGADEAIKLMKSICDTPLALYVYSNDDEYTEKVLMNCTSGGVSVNSTVEQNFHHSVPFGGVGESGFGSYHGKTGFEEYSHMRTIFYRSNEHSNIYIPKPMQASGNVVPAANTEGMMQRVKGMGAVAEN